MKVLLFGLLMSLSLNIYATDPAESPTFFAGVVESLEKTQQSGVSGEGTSTGPIASIYAMNSLGYHITDISFENNPLESHCDTTVKMVSKSGDEQVYIFSFFKSDQDQWGKSIERSASYKNSREYCLINGKQSASINDSELVKEQSENALDSSSQISPKAVRE